MTGADHSPAKTGLVVEGGGAAEDGARCGRRIVDGNLAPPYPIFEDVADVLGSMVTWAATTSRAPAASA